MKKSNAKYNSFTVVLGNSAIAPQRRTAYWQAAQSKNLTASEWARSVLDAAAQFEAKSEEPIK